MDNSTSLFNQEKLPINGLVFRKEILCSTSTMCQFTHQHKFLSISWNNKSLSIKDYTNFDLSLLLTIFSTKRVAPAKKKLSPAYKNRLSFISLPCSDVKHLCLNSIFDQETMDKKVDQRIGRFTIKYK